jgi:hypothetical protein
LRGYIWSADLTKYTDAAGIKARFTLQLELFDVKGGQLSCWNDRFTSDEPVPQKTVTSVVQSCAKERERGMGPAYNQPGANTSRRIPTQLTIVRHIHFRVDSQNNFVVNGQSQASREHRA